MMSRFFIDRPIFAVVLSLLMMIAGTISIYVLPIARFPEVTPPVIQISAAYPGADAQTVAESVAAPIEQQLSGIPNLIYFSSLSSNNGSLTISLTFEIGTDQELAAVEVQNRLSIAEPLLPAEVTRQGITVVKASTNILGVISLESTDGTYDDLFLSNYATINLLDRIKRVQGVGDATVFGNKNYAMRVWLNPDRLALKGMTVSDVVASLRDQNAVFPAGTVGQRPTSQEVELTLPMLTRGRLSDVKEYEDIILRATPSGAMVRLKDVARVELGAQGYNLEGRLNGNSTAAMLVNLQVGANALSTMEGVRREMADAGRDFPPGVRWIIPFDTTTFISESIREIIITLLQAVGLVAVVVFAFLQSWRATLVPLVAVPVSIVGTFAGMLALGFSINTLTLFGLVLAIGIVVDNAIIVIENVERLMADEGLSPRDATIKAMDQVTGPVVASVLVLSAVFVPVAFLGGFSGQMYMQFAVTIAISVAISGVVALTLSPAMCRMILRPVRPEAKKFFLFRLFDLVFGWVTAGYIGVVRVAVRRAFCSMLLFALLGFMTWRMSSVTPTSFLPDEDQGILLAAVLLPEGASLDQTLKVVKQAEAFFAEHPAVEDVTAMVGYDLLTGGVSNPNAATIFVALKPFNERREPGMSASDLLMATYALTGEVRDGLVIAFNPPAIPGLGTRSGFTMELQQRGGGDISELVDVSTKFLEVAGADPRFLGLNASLRISLPQVFIDINREKSHMMGIRLADVFEPMQAYFGSLYVNDFNRFGRIWRVLVQAEPEFRSMPSDVERIYVRNDKGDMAPLSAIINTSFRAGPNVVSRYNGFPAIEITGSAAPGVSSGEAIELLRSLASTTLPPGYGIEWSGASYQELKAGNQAPIVLAFGLLVVFLVLAAQYERWSLPIAVLLAIPIAMLGALVGVFLRGYTQDIYFQIGLLVLVGLAAKNAILIIEFCVALRRTGMGIVEAAIEASRLRFRPFVMTSLTFVLGAVPLALASGAGSAARRSIGTGVIGGMLAATFLAILFVPVFYVVIQRISEWLTGPGRIDGEPSEVR